MPVTPLIWKSRFTANTETAATQDQVQIVQLGNGDFWVSWRDAGDVGPGAPFGTDIVGQRYDALGNRIGGDVRLNNSFSAENERNAKTAADPGDTDFFVVYESFDDPGNYSDIYLERKTETGASSTSLTIAADPTNSNAGINIRNPNIAIASATNGLVVYEQANGGASDIVGRFFNPATYALTGTAFTIPDDGDVATQPQIVALAGGNYVVGWEVAGGGVHLVVVNQSGTVLEDIVRPAHESQLSIAALTTGGFVFSYTDDSDGDDDVGLTMYDAAFNFVGSFAGFAGGPNVQNESRVAATIDGGYVIIWEDDTTSQILMASGLASGAPTGALSPVYGGALSGDPISLTALADGRIAVGFDAFGDANVVIMDPRAEVNAQGVYSPDGRQVGTIGDDVFEADASASIVSGWFGDDDITDGSGVQSLISGNGGDDRITMRSVSSAEHAEGNDGTDRITFIEVLQALTVDLAAGTASANGQTMQATGFEEAVANTLSVSVTLLGGTGVNLLVGGAGNDILDGRAGSDIMQGVGGDDTYVVDNAGDVVIEFGGGGNDRVNASVSYALPAGASIELFATVDNLATTTLNLVGNGFSQYLYGNAGINSFDGGGGGDVMVGLGGNDVYFVRSNDRVVESAGGGFDRLYAFANFALETGSEVEVLSTVDNLATTTINLVGNGLGQYLFGNAGINSFDGGGGGDVMLGFEGNDVYFVRSNDRAVESAGGGFDRLYAFADFTLEADSEMEVLSTVDNLATTAIGLTGNALGQYLFGNAGANILDGKTGADVLSGFGGADGFTFTSALGGGNVDRIVDFNAADDTIRLDDQVFTGLAPGALNANAFALGTAAQDINDRILYDQATGQLFFDADGTGATAAIHFATLDGAPAIAAADFMVI